MCPSCGITLEVKSHREWACFNCDYTTRIAPRRSGQNRKEKAWSMIKNAIHVS